MNAGTGPANICACASCFTWNVGVLYIEGSANCSGKMASARGSCAPNSYCSVLPSFVRFSICIDRLERRRCDFFCSDLSKSPSAEKKSAGNFLESLGCRHCPSTAGILGAERIIGRIRLAGMADVSCGRSGNPPLRMLLRMSSLSRLRCSIGGWCEV